MHNQLEILLELQDLKSQRKELDEASQSREVEEELFHVSIDEAVEQLEQKIAEMEESLDPQTRARYRRLSGSRARAVVPVIGGTCYGCFVAVPTALSSDADRNKALNYCDNCGRFLYMVG